MICFVWDTHLIGNLGHCVTLVAAAATAQRHRVKIPCNFNKGKDHKSCDSCRKWDYSEDGRRLKMTVIWKVDWLKESCE